MKKNARAKNRRAQTAKPRNKPMHEGMMELRQGSRTTPIPSGTVYRRPAPGTKWS